MADHRTNHVAETGKAAREFASAETALRQAITTAEIYRLPHQIQRAVRAADGTQPAIEDEEPQMSWVDFGSVESSMTTLLAEAMYFIDLAANGLAERFKRASMVCSA